MSIAKSKIAVDRIEYAALVEGNERAHDEQVRLQLAKIASDENLAACMSINKTQVDRLVHQDMLIADLRVKLQDMKGRLNVADASIRAMELATATTSKLEAK